MIFSPLIDQLIESLRCLPGVGPKTAQRMAFYLLEQHRDKGIHLSQSIEKAMTNIKHCQKCRTFSETETCALCASTKRDPKLLCIVETPADVIAIEQTGVFRGYYFVLMGHISPLDGIGPEKLGFDLLQSRLTNSEISEIIIATNHTIEGEATAHYITELVKALKIKTSRIAHGIPLGGELEYVDSGTLADALAGRRNYD